MKQPRTLAVRYGGAFILSALALFVRLYLRPFGDMRAPFVTFYIAVVAAVWLYGTGPAVLVALAGAVSGMYFFMAPLHALSVADRGDVIWLGFYCCITASIIAAVDALRRANARLEIEIAARERAQEAEAEQRQWFEMTLRSIGDAVIATDSEGRVAFLNSVAESLTGWNSEDAAERPIGEVLVIRNEETGKPAEIPVFRAIQEGRAIGLANHTILVNRTGLVFPIDDSAAPIRGPRGDLLGVVLVFRDISKRRQVERALQRSLSDMEQFAYLASHDLHEPLRTISAFAALLERRYANSLDATAAEHLGFIVTGARKMQQLITDLLEYSRAGASALSIQPVPVDAMLQDALNALHSSIASSGAIITHDPLPVIYADRVKLTEVLQNLIGNAIKFRCEKRCEIHVSAEVKDGFWCISVRDNGIGFEEKHAERIFHMFQRLSTGDRYSGSGIGLAISKRIVESHQGRIWAESTPGEGSTFHFTIPQASAQPIAESAHDA